MLISPTLKSGPRRSALLPWVVLVVCAGLSVAAWWLVRQEVRRTAQARFEQLTERIQSMIRLRFDTTAQLLHGAAAFPIASDRVTAADWSAYLRQVSGRLGNGAVGLGYVERVARDDVPALEARMRAQGETGFTVERDGLNDWLYVVVGIEPREHNAGVLGLDVGSGTTRRGAAEEAAGRNELVLSRHIRLKYDGRETPGFLLFLPVYRKGAVPAAGGQRLAAVEGWVYAPIRADFLMNGVAESVAQQIDFEVFEAGGTGPDILLYDSDGHLAGQSAATGEGRRPTLQRVLALEIYGRRWLLRMSTLPEFDAAGFSFLPAAVLGGGLGFSLLGALLTWVLVHARSRALRLARDMTADMRRLALLASRTSNGVVLADPEWRIEWINAGFTRLYGYALPEIKGRQPAAFMAGPGTDPKTLEAMARATELRQPFTGEILQYAKDGRKVWIELEIQAVTNEQGELEGFMGLHLDITERRRHEEQMREAVAAAEKASQAKSQFLAVMSHEIRTPMNGVIGMSSLLLDSELTPEQRESAETIRQSGEALLVIINDILDYSRIESGRLELERAEFMLSDCCEGAVAHVAAAAALKSLDLHYEIAADTPAMVVGDGPRLRQVLVNLLGNAVKFTERGEVLLSVAVATRQAAAVDLRLQVRDTGVGIPAEGRERLFKPFSQVDASLTRKYGGVGLGLAICRRLVELMGGTITVESEPGRGSTFTVVLRLPEASGDFALADETGAGLAGRRVLLASDSPTGRRILHDQLRNRNLVPVTVESSAQLVEQLQSPEKFDAAIVDLKIVEADAQTLAARMRALPGRADLPLVRLAATAARTGGVERFNAVLARPIKPGVLLAKLAELFARGVRGPVAAPAVKPSVPPPAEPAPFRILVAEDNPVNQKVTLHQMRSLGYQADLAADGAAALEALRRQPYDVVFLDLFMPVMDGLEAARRIRADLPAETQPWLVALTANAMPGDRESCLAAGMDDYLSKPLIQAELAAALVRAKLRLPS